MVATRATARRPASAARFRRGTACAATPRALTPVNRATRPDRWASAPTSPRTGPTTGAPPTKAPSAAITGLATALDRARSPPKTPRAAHHLARAWSRTQPGPATARETARIPEGCLATPSSAPTAHVSKTALATRTARPQTTAANCKPRTAGPLGCGAVRGGKDSPAQLPANALRARAWTAFVVRIAALALARAATCLARPGNARTWPPTLLIRTRSARTSARPSAQPTACATAMGPARSISPAPTASHKAAWLGSTPRRPRAMPRASACPRIRSSATRTCATWTLASKVAPPQARNAQPTGSARTPCAVPRPMGRNAPWPRNASRASAPKACAVQTRARTHAWPAT